MSRRRALGLLCSACLVALCLFFSFAGTQAAPASSGSEYHLLKRVVLGGEGGWDYLSADPVSHNAFLSRSTHITWGIELGDYL